MGEFIVCRTLSGHRVAFFPQDVRQITEIPYGNPATVCQIVTSSGPTMLADTFDEVWRKVYGTNPPEK